jgi:hypothetical protein
MQLQPMFASSSSCASPVRLLMLIGLLAAAAPGAWAQVAMKSVGVFSLLGDSVQVAVSTDAPKDTRIERTDRYAFEAKGIGFDNIALRALRDALLKSQPKAKVELYKAPAPLLPDEQRAVAQGATNAELPAWIVQTIDANRLSHIILVTRNRGEVNVRTALGVSIGRGTAMGIGYYIDTLYETRNLRTGAMSAGALAPYVHVRMTLMDAQSGEVLRTYEIREGELVGDEQGQGSSDPWTFLTGERKVSVLRKQAVTSLERGARELLKP